MSIMLVLMSAALTASAQQPQPSPNSAPNSPSSATGVSNGELRIENGKSKKDPVPGLEILNYPLSILNWLQLVMLRPTSWQPRVF